MRTRLWWVAGCCAVMAACGRSTPTSPSTVVSLSRTRFLAFGDSITAGEITAPIGGGLVGVNRPMILVPLASYPAQLRSVLLARYPAQASVLAVTNAGKVGEAILDGGARFPDAYAASQADVVLIMEGVNGLGLAGPDLSTEVIRGMVQVATAGGALVLVGSMVPTIEGRPRSQSPAALVAYNGKLQQMAREQGTVFVDLYSVLLPEVNSVIGVDGLHPTEAGYRRIADLFFAAIQAALEVKSRRTNLE